MKTSREKFIRICEVSFIPFVVIVLVVLVNVVVFCRKPNVKQKPKETSTLSTPDDLDQNCSLHLPSEIEPTVKKIGFLNEISNEKSYITKH